MAQLNVQYLLEGNCLHCGSNAFGVEEIPYSLIGWLAPSCL